MSTPSLTEQQRLLRQQLQLQRQHIGHLLARQATGGEEFPRSMTMRLITRHPLLVARLLVQLAMIIGPSHHRSLRSAMLLTRLLQELVSGRSTSPGVRHNPAPDATNRSDTP